LPGRTPYEGRRNFLAPIQRSLSCICRAHVKAPGDKPPGEPEAIYTTESPIMLRSPAHGALALQIVMQYTIIEKSRRNWGASTGSYFYTIDDEVGELISWQWHPYTGNPHPHLHMTGARTDKGLHTPTGRVSFEAVIRYLIDELKVPPVAEHRGDYRQILDTAERAFVDNRSWHG
jgi:hypothetical protein